MVAAKTPGCGFKTKKCDIAVTTSASYIQSIGLIYAS